MTDKKITSSECGQRGASFLGTDEGTALIGTALAGLQR